MAAIANHKDNLLDSDETWVEGKDPSGQGVKYWEDLLSSSTPSKKPADNATLGATFDRDINGLADTHNIELNAVSHYAFVETGTYIPGTETLAVNFPLASYLGSVAIFVSYLFEGNSNASVGHSMAEVAIRADGEAIFGGNGILTTLVDNSPAGIGTTLSMSEKMMHTTGRSLTSRYLVNESIANVTNEPGDLIIIDDYGQNAINYDVSVTFKATGDGTRGKILHLAVYGLVLKR